MRRATRAFAAAVVLGVTLVLAGCGAEKGGEKIPGEVSTIGFSEGTLGLESAAVPEFTVASDISYPPFSFSPRKGPQGFDIDLMDEIAERVGFEVEYKNARFDFITRGLIEGIFDAAISAMTITDNRERQADFSDPYYNVAEALVVRDGSGIGSTDDLAGSTVGVQRGTIGQEEADDILLAGDAGAVRAYRTIEEAFAALRDGQLDVVIYGLPAAQKRVDESGGELKLVEVIPTGARYGIAFPEDSPLVGPVNEALAEIKEDGTYEEIYEKWIGRPPKEIP